MTRRGIRMTRYNIHLQLSTSTFAIIVNVVDELLSLFIIRNTNAHGLFHFSNLAMIFITHPFFFVVEHLVSSRETKCFLSLNDKVFYPFVSHCASSISLYVSANLSLYSRESAYSCTENGIFQAVVLKSTFLLHRIIFITFLSSILRYIICTYIIYFIGDNFSYASSSSFVSLQL